MTKKEIKKELRYFGLYELIHTLITDRNILTSDDLYRYESVICETLDNIDSNILEKAIKETLKK